MSRKTGVTLRLGAEATPADLDGFDETVRATGARSAPCAARAAGDAASAQDGAAGQVVWQDHRLDPPRRASEEGVEMLAGVRCERADAQGHHVVVGSAPRLVPADTVMLCDGQEIERGLAEARTARGQPCHVIGGAELNAKRAIDQGTRLGAAL